MKKLTSLSDLQSLIDPLELSSNKGLNLKNVGNKPIWKSFFLKSLHENSTNCILDFVFNSSKILRISSIALFNSFFLCNF